MRSDSGPVVQATCTDLIDALAADEGLLAAPARSHVAQCLRCQAEMAGYRRLRRSMRSLAQSPVPFDPTLEHEILLALDRHDGRLSRRVPGYAAATLGGLAAAAGVIALATRQRRGPRLAG
jgi:anti-sigma factor RsiW